MENNLFNRVIFVVGVLTVAPIIAEGAVLLVNFGIGIVNAGVNFVKTKKRLEKAVKEGRIYRDQNGDYYELRYKVEV